MPEAWNPGSAWHSDQPAVEEQIEQADKGAGEQEVACEDEHAQNHRGDGHDFSAALPNMEHTHRGAGRDKDRQYQPPESRDPGGDQKPRNPEGIAKEPGAQTGAQHRPSRQGDGQDEQELAEPKDEPGLRAGVHGYSTGDS